MPGIWRKVPDMLMDPRNPLSICWWHLPAALPCFIRFTLNSQRRRAEEISLSLETIYCQILDAYAKVLEAANARDLIVHRGN